MYKFTKKLNWFIACFARGKSGQLRAACFLTGRVFFKNTASATEKKQPEMAMVKR